MKCMYRDNFCSAQQIPVPLNPLQSIVDEQGIHDDPEPGEDNDEPPDGDVNHDGPDDPEPGEDNGEPPDSNVNRGGPDEPPDRPVWNPGQQFV